METNFIDDGYTQQGYIAEVPGLHGPLRFEFRPFLVEERAALFASLDKMSRDAYERKCGHAVADRLVAWDVTDRNGKPVEITGPNVLRLRPTVEDKLLSIMLGVKPTDIDPAWPDADKHSAAEEEYESALSGTNIALLKETRDAKN